MRTTTHDESQTLTPDVDGALVFPGRLDGSDVPLRIRPLAGEILVGRDDPQPRGAWWSLDDPAVSRRHARFTREGSAAYVEDVGSRNGTWVDGVVLRGERVTLADGTVVIVGGELAVFRWLSRDQIAAVEADQRAPLGPVPTASAALALLHRRLKVLAPTDRPILLSGETGTGKEVCARAVHALSGRKGPFVAVNCASFQRELMESQLFGFRRGSHSQAHEDRPGILSTAEGGTLFLDEIGETDPALQAKLLRFLQDGTYFTVGDTRTRRADVRIIAATQAALSNLREDILGRLGEAATLPPLRDRREDLPALCRHFLRRAARVHTFHKDVVRALGRYTWPRNIRELEATIGEAALATRASDATSIGLPVLPPGIRGAGAASSANPPSDDAAPEKGAPLTPKRRMARPTRAELEEVLRQHGGQVAQVARRLQRRREVVWRWCQQLGIDPRAYGETIDPTGRAKLRAVPSPPSEADGETEATRRGRDK